MAKTKRSREKEEFWRLALQEQKQSGLSIREFCRREGLAEPSFYAWRREIAKRDGQSVGETSEATFIPVEVVDERSASKQNPDVLSMSDRLEIVTPGGFTLRLHHETDVHRLGELLRTIARIEEGGMPC